MRKSCLFQFIRSFGIEKNTFEKSDDAGWFTRVEWLSMIVGHSDISITMKYANHASKDLHDAINDVPIPIAING